MANPPCDACGHFNAMLGTNETTTTITRTCRDCGAVVTKRKEPLFVVSYTSAMVDCDVTGTRRNVEVDWCGSPVEKTDGHDMVLVRFHDDLTGTWSLIPEASLVTTADGRPLAPPFDNSAAIANLRRALGR